MDVILANGIHTAVRVLIVVMQVSIISQKLFMHASGLLCVFNLVSVLFVLHGSGAGSVLLIR